MRLELYINGELINSEDFPFPSLRLTEKSIRTKEIILTMMARNYRNKNRLEEAEVYAVFQSRGNQMTDEELDDK